MVEVGFFIGWSVLTVVVWEKVLRDRVLDYFKKT